MRDGVFLFIFMALLAACSDDGDDRACEPGKHQACDCAGGGEGERVCLPDGSGWGECECPCQKECGDRVCGPDPVCGESCGECAGDEICTEEGKCVSGCIPDCAGKECGADGCGGTCPPGCTPPASCSRMQCRVLDRPNKQELIDLLNGLSYQMTYMERPRGPVALPVSDDLEIPEALQIDKLELADPCLAVGLSCGFLGFGAYGEAAGAEVDDQGNLTLAADTIVRFRGIYQENFDLEPQVLALIQVIPASADPCPADWHRCPRDFVCYQRFDQYCAYCTDFLPQVCACQSWEGVIPAGTSCLYWGSYDVLFPGKCSDLGECLQCESNADCTLAPQYPHYCWVTADDQWLGGYYTRCETVGCNAQGPCGADSKCCYSDNSCVPADSPCPP